MLKIRKMRSEDIQFAIRLSNQEKWGVTRGDLTRILQLDPRGSFVAVYGSTRVGLLTTTSYGRKLAWIGNVIVDRKHRGNRIGRTLVQNAIDHLQRTKVEHIGLYCFDENVRFYRRLRFVRDAPFVRLHRKPKPYHPSPLQGKAAPSLPLRELFSADRKAFGADRSRLIQMILRTKAGWYFGTVTRASARSYILVKQYRDMFEFGPWVCIRPQKDQPRQILQSALSKTDQKPIEVSCLRNHRKAFLLFQKNGFETIRHGYRMYLDNIPKIGDTETNYALGFLDKG